MPFFGGGGDYKIIGTNIDGGNDVLVSATGDYNIGLGNETLMALTTGNQNIALGYRVMKPTTVGIDNVGIGHIALSNNVEGENSTAIGAYALRDHINGANNVAVGASALSRAISSLYNTAIGTNSLNFSTSGDYNTAVGEQSGGLLSTGGDNVFIGALADTSNGTFSNQIAIGKGVITTQSNQIRIGNISHTSIFIGGIDFLNPTLTSVIVGDPGTESAGIDINGTVNDASLIVSDIAGTNTSQLILHRHSTTQVPAIIGARSKSDTSAHTAVALDDELLKLRAMGYTGTHYDEFGSIFIGADSTGTISATSSPGAIKFNVTPDLTTLPALALSISNDKKAAFEGTVQAKSGFVHIGQNTDSLDWHTELYAQGAGIGFIVRTTDDGVGRKLPIIFQLGGFTEYFRFSTEGILCQIAGTGLRVKEGSNAKQGTAVLVAGTVTVANTSVTANSRIFLTSQVDGGTPGFLRVSARVAGTSFTITSSSATDTSTVAYEIFEPS